MKKQHIMEIIVKTTCGMWYVRDVGLIPRFGDMVAIQQEGKYIINLKHSWIFVGFSIQNAKCMDMFMGTSKFRGTVRYPKKFYEWNMKATSISLFILLKKIIIINSAGFLEHVN